MSSFELQWLRGGYTVRPDVSAKRMMKFGRKADWTAVSTSFTLFQCQLLEVASLDSTVCQLLCKRLWVKLLHGISLIGFLNRPSNMLSRS